MWFYTKLLIRIRYNKFENKISRLVDLLKIKFRVMNTSFTLNNIIGCHVVVKGNAKGKSSGEDKGPRMCPEGFQPFDFKDINNKITPAQMLR